MGVSVAGKLGGLQLAEQGLGAKELHVVYASPGTIAAYHRSLVGEWAMNMSRLTTPCCAM
jgi:hypothetical protein